MRLKTTFKTADAHLLVGGQGAVPPSNLEAVFESAAMEKSDTAEPSFAFCLSFSKVFGTSKWPISEIH